MGLIAGGIVVGAVGLGPLAPQANAQKSATASSWCSETGDSCVALYLRNGKVVAEHGYAARYGARDRVCVKPPRAKKICRTRPLQRVRKGNAYVARFAVKARPGVWSIPVMPGLAVRVRVPG